MFFFLCEQTFICFINGSSIYEVSTMCYAPAVLSVIIRVYSVRQIP